MPKPLIGSQLGAVLDAIPAMVALLDCGLCHRHANDDYVRFTGMTDAVLTGCHLDKIAAAIILRGHAERAMSGEKVSWEGWLPGSDGADARFVKGLCLPFRAAGRGIDGCLFILRDLTDLKQTERRFAEQVADLQLNRGLNAAITASALDCIIVIDEAGCVVEFNPAAELTFGHARAAVLGRPIADIIVPEHLRERHVQGFARYLATGEAHVLGRRMEIEGLRADGAVFPLELAITEVRLPGRRLFTAYLRDLTAAHAAQADVQRSRDALHQGEKMAAFGSLLAGVAHELNNPLSIVIGNAMMLSDDAAGFEGPLVTRVGKIAAAAERCARIVRSFLAMARQRPTVLRPVAIAPLVHVAVEMLAYGFRAGGIGVTLDLPVDLPNATGDSDQLHQVLVNLLLNAKQALLKQPLPRQISIAARVEAGEVVLRLSDNGPGVPHDIRTRIFDPFFTTKPMGEGTGIGLAVSRGIVEAHGGTLVLKPQGPGAQFDVRLPLALEVEAAPAAEPASIAALPTLPRRALIIDDEPEVASVLAQMVTSLGFACDMAEGGGDGQHLLERGDYDAILCDLHMPGIDGAALLQWIGAHKPQFRGRLAFVTGDTLGQATASFLSASGRPHLEKPFLREEIRRVLSLLKFDS